MLKTLQFTGKNEIPILAEVDLLVIGGGIGGIAAAKTYAERGKSVYVVESSICLGHEMTACMRPWVYWNEEDAALLSRYFPIGAAPSAPQTLPLIMKDLKCKLEDVLLAHSVGILYASYPIRVEDAEGKHFVVIANKSGLQGIVCAQMLDATQQGMISAIAKGNPAALRFTDAFADVRVCMEFTGVGADVQAAYSMPAAIKNISGAIATQKGAFSDDHVFLDIPLRVKNIEGNCYEQDLHVERAARETCMAVAAYLHHSVPAFAKALLGLISKKTLRGAAFDPASAIKQGEALASALTDQDVCAALYSPDIQVCHAEKHGDAATGYTLSRVNGMAKTRGFTLREAGALTLPVILESGVNIAGGGTSGAVAALSSAREKVKTSIVEMNHMLGGTATVGGVNMYWMATPFAYTREIDAATVRNQNAIGYPEIYLDYNWNLPSGEIITHQRPFSWSMEVKAKTLLDLCLGEDVTVYTDACIFAAVKDKNAVKGVCFATAFGAFALLSEVTVDATGDGDVAAFAGAEYTYGNTRDRMTMFTAMSPLDRPAHYGGCFFVTCDVEDIVEYSSFIILSRRRPMDKVRYDHANMVSPRETRHITGEIELTLKDQMLLRAFPDTIHISFSNYDLKGKAMAEVVLMGILPPATDVEIPYRAIVPKRVEGLLMSGRGYSITHDALAGPRMQTDMQEFGASCGLAAALAVKNGVLPRALNVRELQERLVAKDCVWPRVTEDRVYDAEFDLQALIDSLAGDEPFNWLLMASDERLTKTPVVAQLYYAETEKILPLLLKAYEKAEGARRKLLARVLAWHGSEAGIHDVLEQIDFMMSQGTPLPKVERENYFAGTSPNQENAPDLVFWLNATVRAGAEKALPLYKELVERIHSAKRDYKDVKASIFEYVECVAYAAERTGLPGFVPLLKSLLTLPELKKRIVTDGIESDFFKERQAWLVHYLYRAIARCGDKAGLKGLCAMLRDKRMTVSKNSLIELTSITGISLPLDAARWEEALHDWPEQFAAQPWRGRVD